MPANYAHHRFGKQVLPALPADVRQCIQRFRRMYDMGLHGPDIFFYYNPLMKTTVGSLSNQYHAMTGREFFPAACAAAGTEAARAYLYGLLGHYCLDSVCHPYVRRLVEIGEADHVVLEAEFDRFLLALDKEPSPHTYDMSKRFRLTRGECMTVAEFYPPATGANVSRSVTLMSLLTRLLASPNRQRTETLLKKADPSLRNMMLPEQEVEELSLYVHELKGLYDQAVDAYPALLAQLTAAMASGEPLGEDFAPDFG